MPRLEQAIKGCDIAYNFRGKRFDIPSIDGFVKANHYGYANIYQKGK
jgi:UTP--glucose-1-phosphate uridylyltransferase